MKKILLLGGSYQQLVAIKAAKAMGHCTIVCDYLHDNPGQYEADKYYCISTTDVEAVHDVASKENVDGILAYASDPAALPAAIVAEQIICLPMHHNLSEDDIERAIKHLQT